VLGSPFILLKDLHEFLVFKRTFGSGFFWGKKSISEISEPLVLSCFGTQNKPSDPGFLKFSKELTDLMKEPTKN
jgi:hypothetical protein